MLRSISRQDRLMRSLCSRNIIGSNSQDKNCTPQTQKTAQLTYTTSTSSPYKIQNHNYDKFVLEKNLFHSSISFEKSNLFRYLSGKDGSDNSDISSSSPPSNGSSSGGDEGSSGNNNDDDLAHLPSPELGPHMTALSPINVPDVWPSVPVIAIKRTPLFPKYALYFHIN